MKPIKVFVVSVLSVLLLSCALNAQTPGQMKFWDRINTTGTPRYGEAWRTPLTSSPLQYVLGTRTFSIAGLNTMGSPNYIPGVNASGTGWEYKQFVAGTGLSIIHSPNTVTFNIALQTSNYTTGSIPATAIASGQVVKSLNGLYDLIKIVGKDGATVTVSNDTIYIAANSSGTGVTAVQNLDGTLTIQNGTGPTATLSLANDAADSNKIKNGHITNSKIKDGTIITADFNASAKAPFAGTADFAAPTGAAGGDLAGTYPNPTVAANAIASAEVQDGTITRSDVTTTFKAPYADTADHAKKAYLHYYEGTLTPLPGVRDTVNITVTGMTTSGAVIPIYADTVNTGRFTLNFIPRNGFVTVISSGDEPIAIKVAVAIIRRNSWE